MEIVKFGSDDALNTIAKMGEASIEKLSFGAIQLDDKGTILQFNSLEGEIVGRDPKEVIGKNFFDEVAPCAKSREFYGRFLDGVKNNDLSVLFEYNFDYQMSPTRVKVHMKKAIIGDTFWVFVKRL